MQAKGQYKEAFARLRTLKSEIEHLHRLLEHNRLRLQREFETWLTDARERAGVALPSIPLQTAQQPQSSQTSGADGAVDSSPHASTSKTIPQTMQHSHGVHAEPRQDAPSSGIQATPSAQGRHVHAAQAPVNGTDVDRQASSSLASKVPRIPHINLREAQSTGNQPTSSNPASKAASMPCADPHDASAAAPGLQQQLQQQLVGQPHALKHATAALHTQQTASIFPDVAGVRVSRSSSSNGSAPLGAQPGMTAGQLGPAKPAQLPPLRGMPTLPPRPGSHQHMLDSQREQPGGSATSSKAESEKRSSTGQVDQAIGWPHHHRHAAQLGCALHATTLLA